MNNVHIHDTYYVVSPWWLILLAILAMSFVAWWFIKRKQPRGFPVERR